MAAQLWKGRSVSFSPACLRDGWFLTAPASSRRCASAEFYRNGSCNRKLSRVGHGRNSCISPMPHSEENNLQIKYRFQFADWTSGIVAFSTRSSNRVACVVRREPPVKCDFPHNRICYEFKYSSSNAQSRACA